MTLVLGVSTTAIAILNQRQGGLAEQRFFETLKTAVNESSTSANIYRTPLQIIFQKDNEVLVQIKTAKAITIRKIPIPKSIKLAGGQLVRVAASGFISPQTVKWYALNGELKYLQKFQLGWSGFKIEKKKVTGIYNR
ncbi:hypothetical protein [Lentilactobacillus senioris]|uniref:hypothetical protein n=1 Tax=Lentilactobacillus senioris TaxID=931534 RepID=UPI0020927153|nr:hypothetical protein [Lentilactobacillus senioris]